jgi:uncharacterized protein (DUF1697 family)
MPAKQIALPRGINVGKAKRIAMSDLRALVEELGFRDVQTLLNSGNVIYSAGRVSPSTAASRIEKALVEKTGVAARVTVVTAEEIAEVVAANPLLDVAVNHSRLFVNFLNDAADLTKLQPLSQQDWGVERLAFGPRVAYLWCPEGPIDSPLSKAVNKVLRDGVTARNWATVLKLQALANV